MKKIILLLAVTLVGCGDSTPKCDDTQATDLAKQIVTQNYFGGLLPFKFFEADITNARAASYNKDIGLYTCKATFTGKFGTESIKDKPESWSDTKKEIEYTVQLNSEKEIIVEARW